LKLRFYKLMARYHQIDEEYLEIARCYQVINTIIALSFDWFDIDTKKNYNTVQAIYNTKIVGKREITHISTSTTTTTTLQHMFKCTIAM
jgi:hypothetical protein